MYKKI